MVYVVKRPNVNTKHEVWYDVKYTVLWGVLVVIALLVIAAKGLASSVKIAEDVLQLVIIVVMILVGYVTNQYLVRFWKDMARENGWEYEANGNPSAEQAVMFRQGHTQTYNQCNKRCNRWAQFSVFSLPI